MTTYTFTFRDPTNRNMKAMRAGLAAMSRDILNMAKRNAPVQTGALRNSGHTETNGDTQVVIKFGGGKVRYALRREYENRLHPGTRFYLKRAGHAAAARYQSYFPFSVGMSVSK